MATLTDSVFIQATPEAVENWFRELPSHYNEWHPAHSHCTVTGGEITSPGAEFQLEETLHGAPHSLHAKVTRVDHNGGLLVEYSIFGFMRRLIGMKGAFRILPYATGSIFTTTISVWPPVWLCNLLFTPQLKALSEHMQEEGENLKTLLERDNPPYTI